MSQEFDSEVLDLVKQKGFYPDEYTSSFEKKKKKKVNNSIMTIIQKK